MTVGAHRLLACGIFGTYGYFAIDDDTGHGLLIDPGAQPGLFLDAVRNRHWQIDAILLTHGHFDHMGAAAALRDAWDVPIMAHELADAYLLDPVLNLSLSSGCGNGIILRDVVGLSDGDRIPVGSDPDAALEVLHVPGHTDDSCAFWCGEIGVVFVGDTVQEEGPGLTVFPTGDERMLHESIRSRLLTLPPDTILLPGHSEPITVGQLRTRM